MVKKVKKKFGLFNWSKERHSARPVRQEDEAITDPRRAIFSDCLELRIQGSKKIHRKKRLKESLTHAISIVIVAICCLLRSLLDSGFDRE